MKQIEVVAAIIHDSEGRIFATQRGYGDYKDGWEFPGGKMEPDETPEKSQGQVHDLSTSRQYHATCPCDYAL